VPATSPTRLSIARLRAAVAGRVIAPEDPDYDAARTVAMGDIDRLDATVSVSILIPFRARRRISSRRSCP
jgi:hypothetical protein